MTVIPYSLGAPADPFAFRRTYSLKRGYSVELEISNGQFFARWTPDVPPVHLRSRLLAAYRSARSAFFKELGIPALVVEL